MCFGSKSGPSPDWKPANYPLDQAHTQVKTKQEAAPPEPETEDPTPREQRYIRQGDTGTNLPTM
jgi:hypothetical protein